MLVNSSRNDQFPMVHAVPREAALLDDDLAFRFQFVQEASEVFEPNVSARSSQCIELDGLTPKNQRIDPALAYRQCLQITRKCDFIRFTLTVPPVAEPAIPVTFRSALGHEAPAGTDCHLAIYTRTRLCTTLGPLGLLGRSYSRRRCAMRTASLRGKSMENSEVSCHGFPR